MIDANTAKQLVQVYVPGAKIEQYALSQGDFIVRVAFPSDEQDLDPFFIVNGESGEVQEFAVMDDDNMDRIAEAFNISLD